MKQFILGGMGHFSIDTYQKLIQSFLNELIICIKTFAYRRILGFFSIPFFLYKFVRLGNNLNIFFYVYIPNLELFIFTFIPPPK